MFPKILATSIKRCSIAGPHGQLYLIDFNSNTFSKVFELDSKINTYGRGGERGLRGIVFDKNTNRYFVAKHNSIIILDKNFLPIDEVFNNYFGDIHDLYLFENILYVVSTAFNSIIAIDINNNSFRFGLYFNFDKTFIFKNNASILKQDKSHVNNVFVNKSGIYVCGTKLDGVYKYLNGKTVKYASVPLGTHNAQPYNDLILCNDTDHSKVIFCNLQGQIVKQVNKTVIDPEKMINCHKNDRIVRQPFARGLSYSTSFLFGGSPPDMVSVYDINSFELIKEINMSFDITNAIYGVLALS
jgi:hypothetical protein